MLRLRLLLAQPLATDAFPGWCARLSCILNSWSGARSPLPASAALQGLRPSNDAAHCEGSVVDAIWSLRGLPAATQLDELIARLNVPLDDGSHVRALFALGVDPGGGELWFSFARQHGQPCDHKFYKVMRGWGASLDVQVTHGLGLDGQHQRVAGTAALDEGDDEEDEEDEEEDDSETERNYDAFLWEGTYPSYRCGAGIDAGHWHYSPAFFGVGMVRLELPSEGAPGADAANGCGRGPSFTACGWKCDCFSLSLGSGCERECMMRPFAGDDMERAPAASVELRRNGQLLARGRFAPCRLHEGAADAPRRPQAFGVLCSTSGGSATEAQQSPGSVLLHVDLYAHLVNKEYVRAMEAVLPGWGDEAARRRHYLEATLRQSRRPELHETAKRIVAFALSGHHPLSVLTIEAL